MLVDFSVENFGAFRDKVSISLLKTSLDEIPENLLRCDALVGDGALNSAVLFGPNSSGKSTMIYAMKVLQSMVAAPMPANYSYPWYRPYRVSTRSSKSPSSFEIRFTIGTTLFLYGISFDRYHVVSEFLFQYPSGHKSLVFSRKEQEFTIGRNVSKGQKAITQMTNPSSSYLSVAAQFNNEICLAAHKVLTQEIIVVSGDQSSQLIKAASILERNPNIRNLTLRSLNITDFGITGIECNANYDMPNNFFSDVTANNQGGEPTAIRMLLKHDYTTDDASAWNQYFPIQVESTGTRQMIAIMTPIVEALYSGKVVMIDEFGSNLHPEIAKWIVSQFKRRSNPNRAQLIISTNDHFLMDTDTLFRRDQIFFTRRNSIDGSAEVYSLFDFEDSFDGNVDMSAKLSQTLPFISGENIL